MQTTYVGHAAHVWEFYCFTYEVITVMGHFTCIVPAEQLCNLFLVVVMLICVLKYTFISCFVQMRTTIACTKYTHHPHKYMKYMYIYTHKLSHVFAGTANRGIKSMGTATGRTNYKMKYQLSVIRTSPELCEQSTYVCNYFKHLCPCLCPCIADVRESVTIVTIVALKDCDTPTTFDEHRLYLLFTRRSKFFGTCSP